MVVHILCESALGWRCSPTPYLNRENKNASIVIESCSRTLELPLRVGSVVFLFLLASTEG